MKKLSKYFWVKLAVCLFWGLVLLFVGRDLYRCYNRSQTVDPSLVEAYRPGLNNSLVKQAAGYLNDK